MENHGNTTNKGFNFFNLNIVFISESQLSLPVQTLVITPSKFLAYPFKSISANGFPSKFRLPLSIGSHVKQSWMNKIKVKDVQ